MIAVFALSLAFGFGLIVVSEAVLRIGDFLNDCGRDSLIIALQEMADCGEVRALLDGKYPADPRFKVFPPVLPTANGFCDYIPLDALVNPTASDAIRRDPTGFH